ncbi:MAG: serine/threonine-protein kinase [Gemmatimonadota bacterium]
MSGVPESLAKALAPEFEVLRPLGTGRLGVVYLARETALRRLVAIKLPRPELVGDKVVEGRFEREARAAARLSHPNIVPIHRVGRLPDGTPYIVMGYVEGHTLADALEAEGPLPERTAIAALAQLASALAAAHAQRVIHRDVRPGTVIWQPEQERAVFTDFGLAGILETGSEAVTQLTAPGQRIGEPVYASPEQLLGEPLTPATDVYGLGVLAFEVLTLQKPYRATSPAEAAAAHLHQPPRDLTELLPSVDRRCAELLRRCLTKKPEHRPRAAELARRLEAMAVGSQPAVAGGAGAPSAAAPAGSRAPGAAGEPDGFALGLHAVDDAVERLPALQAFLVELKQRRVYNVAIVYIAAAGMLLAGAQLILEGTPLPDSVYSILVATTLLGFPVAIMLGWLFDLTSHGIERTRPPDAATSRLAVRLLLALTLVLSSLFAGLIGWWLLRSYGS